jgi:predicted hydrocarbon binding protein
MKTFCFYSYKGGTGRTLCISNLAVCLARLDYNVVLIDFDFEAPGIPYKMGKNLHRSIKKGVVEYFFDHIKKAKLKASSRNDDDDDEKILPAYVPLDPIEPYSVFEKELEKGNGSIKLFPAGNTEGNNYWELLTKKEWRQLFASDFTEMRQKKRNIRFFEELKEKIEQLTPTPDILLVDCKSGISEVSYLTNIIWADAILCFFNTNEENKYRLKSIFEAFFRLNIKKEEIEKIVNKGLEDDSSGVEIIPVLSRVPASHAKEIEEELKSFIFAKKDIDESELMKLHIDRKIEESEQLRIPPEGNVPNKRLAHDYVNLCANLLKRTGLAYELSLQFGSEDELELDGLKNKIYEKIGLKPELEEEERIFDLSLVTGKLINPNDQQPNVAFKIETFVKMLREIFQEAQRTVYESGTAKEQTSLRVAGMYRAAGATCGENFGSALNHMWSKDGGEISRDKDGERNKIQKWCEFDSDVGFGKFISSFSEEKSDFNELVIDIVSNFLTLDQKEDDPNLCLLMEGYIEGILKRISDPTVRVKHPKEYCQRVDQERESCGFVVSRENY